MQILGKIKNRAMNDICIHIIKNELIKKGWTIISHQDPTLHISNNNDPNCNREVLIKCWTACIPDVGWETNLFDLTTWGLHEPIHGNTHSFVILLISHDSLNSSEIFIFPTSVYNSIIRNSASAKNKYRVYISRNRKDKKWYARKAAMVSLKKMYPDSTVTDISKYHYNFRQLDCNLSSVS
jgi:hypothetical protein